MKHGPQLVWQAAIILSLLLGRSAPAADSSGDSTILENDGKPISEESDEIVSPVYENIHSDSVQFEEVASTDSKDVKIAPEFIFAEAVSQNSGLSDGIGESGQPTIITLVDNVAAELADVARNVDAVDHGISPNFSGSYAEFELPQILKSLESNETDSNDTGEILTEANYTAPISVGQDETEVVANGSKDISQNETVSIDNVIESKLPNNETENKKLKLSNDDQKPETQEEIPSFSEWAQKQLEEAEKNKEVTLNDSAQSTHKTITSATNLKIRSKNYASPDCGAKIVAANSEAGSAGFILSSSRDEYMLNTCTSRIWFIVELCEAIQAKKIELANFELFSSTPKNFSVSVSDRFPTREWAGVGQFIAKDERDIQTFNLHPHLFGKFIKVELHSHYGSEHYCPISLFRVYGTSEFEVFETENSPQSQTNQDNDDDDDDDVIENIIDPEKNGDVSKNLFGSARDAVMSIMKKAAEVLVKSSDSKNASIHETGILLNNKKCQTPSHIVVCNNCGNPLFTKVYDLMSCESDYLKRIVDSPLVYRVMCNSDMCQPYGLDFKTKKTSLQKTEIAKYISALFVPSYVAALCNMLAIVEKKVVLNTSYETDLNITSNLTIDKKANKMINVGLLDDLLQEPFTTCEGELCKETIPIDNKNNKENIQENSPVPPNEDINNIPDINPTKTIQNSVDNVETTIFETQPVVPTNLEENKLKVSVDDGKENGLTNSSNNNPEIKIEEQQAKGLTDGEINDKVIEEAPTITKETTNTTINDTSSSQILGQNSHTINSNVEDSNSSQDQLVLDRLLSELEQGSDFSTPAPTQNSMAPPSQGQKESVFLRLSNRIKALEKNMSLSGQYLEELSRRYKKQVEEMQKTFEKTLLTINEESKRSEERERKYSEEMFILQQQIVQLSVSVGLLLSERDSWMGGVSFFKIVLTQIIVTVIIVFLYLKTGKKTNTSNDNSLNEVLISNKGEVRRNSVTGVVRFSEAECVNSKRRLSEEILSQSTDISCLCVPKSDKKKKKRKASTIQRSVSIANEADYILSKNKSTPDEKMHNNEWLETNLNTSISDTPIALEESEFIVPEIEPIDFSQMGEIRKPSTHDITPKKEFPKTNGSIFGMKMIHINKKPVKERRLSSPALIKPADTKTVFKNEGEDSINNDSSPISQRHMNDVNPLDLTVNSDFAQLNEWPSAGELSQVSTSASSTTSKGKRSKKSSFKNMLKKVF